MIADIVSLLKEIPERELAAVRYILEGLAAKHCVKASEPKDEPASDKGYSNGLRLATSSR